MRSSSPSLCFAVAGFGGVVVRLELGAVRPEPAEGVGCAWNVRRQRNATERGQQTFEAASGRRESAGQRLGRVLHGPLAIWLHAAQPSKHSAGVSSQQAPAYRDKQQRDVDVNATVKREMTRREKIIKFLQNNSLDSTEAEIFHKT